MASGGVRGTRAVGRLSAPGAPAPDVPASQFLRQERGDHRLRAVDPPARGSVPAADLEQAAPFRRCVSTIPAATVAATVRAGFGLRPIAVAIGSNIVNTAFAPVVRRTPGKARYPASNYRNSLNFRHFPGSAASCRAMPPKRRTRCLRRILLLIAFSGLAPATAAGIPWPGSPSLLPRRGAGPSLHPRQLRHAAAPRQ